jgi:hypothetical protein
MTKDIFSEAEANFAYAEKSLTAFWDLIKKPIMFIFNKIVDLLEGVFQSEDETTKFQLKKLPL